MPFSSARLAGAPPRIAAVLLCIWALFFISPIQAAQTPAQTMDGTASYKLTLAEAIRFAMEQNPGLRVFDFRDTALQGRATSANLRPALELEAELENFAGGDSFSGVDAAELTVALSSVIELGGKRQARVDSVNSARYHLQAQRQAEALDLLGEVIRRYVDVLAAGEKVALARDSVRLASDTQSAVQKRVTAAASPIAEGMRAEAALVEARLTLMSEQQQLRYLKLALASLWGDTAAEFSLDGSALYRFGPETDFAELFKRAQQNPAITVFATERRLRESELRLAQTQSSTDIRWSVGVRRLQESDNSALVAGFSLPLFSAKRNTGAVTSAMAARDQVDLRREAALLQMHTQLFRAFSNRRQAIVTADRLQKNVIPTLARALSETERAYRRGRYSYLEWASAREALIGARRSMIEAASAALRYGADIEQLTGESLFTAELSPQLDLSK